MKVFADTNFLVSAFASRGLSSEVLMIILAEHDLITGEVIMEELKRVLASKIKLPLDQIQEVEDFVRNFTVVPKPDKGSDVALRDEDDKWVLQSALDAGADILITGDRDLLDEAENIKEINIMNTRSFLELVRGHGF